MPHQVPVLRSCGYCRGTGERGRLPCLACTGAGLVWVDVPDEGHPGADRLPPQRPASES